MEGLVTDTPKGRFISILADGKFHEKVEEGTDGAILRKWESKDGSKSGEKWELVYGKVENVLITNVAFEDGEYGENLLITLSDGENEVVLAQGTATNFGEDLLKKLPAVDFAEKVTIQPYAFTDDRDKPRRGVNIYQKSDKVMNFFWDEEKKTLLHGYPVVDKKEDESWSKDEWKAYFLQARIFLVKYAKERLVPKFQGGDEIKPEDIPF